MDGPVAQSNLVPVIEPGERVLEPVVIVSLGKILARMSAAALRASERGMKTDACLGQHIVQFQRLGELRVEDHRTVGDLEVRSHHLDDASEHLQAGLEQRTVAEDGAVALHGPLHRQANRRGRRRALGPSDLVEARKRAVSRTI
jgi:hypothetical protein